jgi:hypothetical protein
LANAFSVAQSPQDSISKALRLLEEEVAKAVVPVMKDKTADKMKKENEG